MARILLLAPFAIVGVRAAHLSVDERGIERGEHQTRRVLEIAPGRGAIVDANGAELALSVDSPSIYAIPAEIGDIEAAAAKLAPILGTQRQALAARLRDRRSFLFLARWVSAERAQQVLELGIAGVGLVDEPRRIYPHRELAAQAVGFANIDGVGVRGIEQQEDDWLRGMARRIPVERDARGRKLWIGGDSHWSTTGGDVALTIDATLQAQAEEALRETVKATRASGGVVVAMNPWNGDILALAENPGFDPNQFRTLDFSATRSRAFSDALDPGSTLKAFLVAAALDAHAIESDQVFDCENGSFAVPGKLIRDHHPNGKLTAAGILRVSSNIGAVKIAHELGRSAHHRALRRFGFGASTESGFPGESAGLLRAWQDWRPLDHATIAYGQGISVTPIQLAAATSAFANGGLWVQPRLVAARRAPGGTWHASRSSPGRRAIAEETARAVLAMLESVVSSEGTGSLAALQGVRVAGKTGTPQKYDSASQSFATDRYEAWFIGVAPVDDPKLAIVVRVDEAQRPAHTGGMTAAPLFARVAAAQLTRYGIFTEPERRLAEPSPMLAAADQDAPPAVSAAPPVSPPRSAAAPRTPAPRATAAAVDPGVVERLTSLGDRVLLPDFRGRTVAEVKRMTAGRLEVEISGEGRAVTQQPPPGTVFALHSGRVQIRFELSSQPDGEGDI
ncbi:MAG TPA: penicillin-binding transpeptidase domain-containing protein [Myxococcota bacterium]|nr:penicillin-binding transpeptidase domain-containing protein [Myxococcota bacterium]